MKKTTINTILLCIIAIMSVSICFLIICIVTRPRYVTVNDTESASGAEVVNIMEEPQLAALPAASDGAVPATEADTPSTDTKHGKTSTRVNIRDAASADAKVLDTWRREPPLTLSKYRTTAGQRFSTTVLKPIFHQTSSLSPTSKSTHPSFFCAVLLLARSLITIPLCPSSSP